MSIERQQDTTETKPVNQTVPTSAVTPRTSDDCNFCKIYSDSVMMPPHSASADCKSGGYNHCTCSGCF